MCERVHHINSCVQESSGHYSLVIWSEYCLLRRFCCCSCRTPGQYFSKLNNIHKLVQNRRKFNAYEFDVHQLNNHTHPEEDELSCYRRYYMTSKMRVHKIRGKVHMPIAVICKSCVLLVRTCWAYPVVWPHANWIILSQTIRRGYGSPCAYT